MAQLLERPNQSFPRRGRDPSKPGGVTGQLCQKSDTAFVLRSVPPPLECVDPQERDPLLPENPPNCVAVAEPRHRHQSTGEAHKLCQAVTRKPVAPKNLPCRLPYRNTSLENAIVADIVM